MAATNRLAGIVSKINRLLGETGRFRLQAIINSRTIPNRNSLKGQQDHTGQRRKGAFLVSDGKKMKKAVILGIHSNVAGDENGLTSGHAWISVTTNGKVQSYGLWPDEHPHTVDNGDGSDIRIGMEGTKFPVASRFYSLLPGQAAKLELLLKQRVAWRYTNTCASWASELIEDVTGVDVDADDWAGFETPRELGKHILKLEKKHPTSRWSPAMAVPNASSW